MARIIRNKKCCPTVIKDPCADPCETKPTKSCSCGCGKGLYTGEVTSNDFEDGVHLISSNVGLLTVDNTYFKMEDIKDERDKCGNLFGLPVKNGSHITISKEFKEIIELLTSEGGLENFLRELFMKPTFKSWFSKYFKLLVSAGFIDICDLISSCNIKNTPSNNAPTLSNRDLGVIARIDGEIDQTFYLRDLLEAYNDVEGDLITHFYIEDTPGSTPFVGITKGYWTPINSLEPTFILGFLDQISDGNITSFRIKVRNNKNQDSNFATFTYSIIDKITEPVNSRPTLDRIEKNSPIDITDITDAYNDIEGDELTHVYFEKPSGECGQSVVLNPERWNTWIPINEFVSLTKTVSNSSECIINYKVKNNKEQESDMGQIVIRNLGVPDTEERCVCLIDDKIVFSRLTFNREYEDVVIDNVVPYRNNCSTPYTINRVIPTNRPELEFRVKGTIPGNSEGNLSVHLKGRIASTIPGESIDIRGSLIQSCGTGDSKTISISATMENSDTLDYCVNPDDNKTFEYNIIRNSNINIPDREIRFINRCGSNFTMPEKVIINENGLKVFIPAFEILANQELVRPIRIEGNYTGTKSTIKSVATIGNRTVTVTVNITNANTKPITNDVNIERPNRVNVEITAESLIWSDPERDPLQAVKFTDTQGNLFTNAEMTVPYVDETELQPNFRLYHKAPNQDPEFVRTFKYQVKAGEMWSGY